MTKPFTDHFGSVSSHYANARPSYPDALFAWISTLCAQHQQVWDCGAGSGQASTALAEYFSRVVATDPSEKQISHAIQHPKIEYRIASAEDSGLADASVDMVTVAQALHWFDFERFFAEARRVLKPQGVLAAWSYGRQRIEGDEVNAVFQRFYRETAGPFWPPERRHVEQGYRSIPFPFPLLAAPAFEMQVKWNLPQLLSYIRSWSACAAYVEAKGIDPVLVLEPELAAVWGDRETPRTVEWPLTVLAGIKQP